MQRNKLHNVPGAALLVLLAAVGCRSGDANRTGCRDCSVVLISLDTLRADHLGAYGYTRASSPCIDRFAVQATVFEQSFSQATWTLPSHMSIFTSLNPREHGVVATDQRLSKSRITLTEVLAAEGYATAGFTGGYNVAARYGFDRGFAEYHESYPGEVHVSGKGSRLRDLAPAAFAWLEAHRGKKFFLFLHSYDTHEPFLAHPGLEQFDPGYDGQLSPIDDGTTFEASELYRRYRSDISEAFNINAFLNLVINKGTLQLTDADRRHIVALYDNEIRFVDESICALLGKLDALGLTDNTIVILTSDHGEQLLERGQVDHGGPAFEEVIRVPLIVRAPGHSPGRSDKLAQGIDVAPTVLALLGLPPQRTFTGKALFPLGSPGTDSIIIADVDTIAIRTHDRKAMFTAKQTRLFDLDADPEEKSDISAREPESVRKLRARIRDEVGQVDLSEADREALRMLGYDNK